LLHRLRTFYPAGGSLVIDRLYVANLRSAPELVGGLAANARGASYTVEDVSFNKPAAKIRAQLVTAVPANACPTQLSIRLDDGGTTDPARRRFDLKGATLRLGSPGLAWDGASRQFALDLSCAGLSFVEGERATLTCTATASDGKPRRAGQWSWTVALKGDPVPPPPPRVSTCFGSSRTATFERDLEGWQNVGGQQGASLWRDSSTAAEGAFSLRLYHRELAGPFAAQAGLKPFDVRRYPLLCFDYRIAGGVELNLFLESAGSLREVRFTDDNATWPVVGAIPNVQTDGQWHRAEVDLGALVRVRGLPSPVIDRILFGDAGIMNCLQDVSWHLDNFQLVPALPAGRAGALQWSGADVSGIAGYSWSFDNSPTTTPDETSEGAGASAPLPADPAAAYLHVRALDRAGNWGPPAHFRFARSTEAPPEPAVAAVSPATDAEFGAPRISVAFKPADAVDLDSLSLKVTAGGKPLLVRPGDASVRFDPATGKLDWDGSRSGATASWPAQTAVECTLTFGGLGGGEPKQHTWKWKLNRALDKQGPPAPYVSYIPANRLCRYNFERSSFGDSALRRAAWVILDDPAPAATGTGTLRSLNLEANDFFSTYLRKLSFRVDQFPRVAFDYRFEPSGGCNLILVSLVNGDMQVVDFAGQNASYNVFLENRIGTVGQTLQNGKWHHVDFSFENLLKKRYPETSRFLAKYLGTWATGARTTYDTPQGVSHWLDNITFYSPKSDAAGFEWQLPADDNGVVGYSYVLDQKADTVPPTKVTTRDARCTLKGLKPGKWFFHVRAVDGAGNWGEPGQWEFELG